MQEVVFTSSGSVFVTERGKSLVYKPDGTAARVWVCAAVCVPQTEKACIITIIFKQTRSVACCFRFFAGFRVVFISLRCFSWSGVVAWPVLSLLGRLVNVAGCLWNISTWLDKHASYIHSVVFSALIDRWKYIGKYRPNICWRKVGVAWALSLLDNCCFSEEA